jgi:hypothetical protein
MISVSYGFERWAVGTGNTPRAAGIRGLLDLLPAAEAGRQDLGWPRVLRAWRRLALRAAAPGRSARRP